MKTLNSETLLA